MKNFENINNVDSVESEGGEVDFNLQFNKLRKEYLEAIAETDIKTGEKIDKEKVLNRVQVVHAKFIALGIQFHELYEKEASPISSQSFKQAIYANKNRFNSLVAERGYFIPESNQKVFMVGGDDKKALFEFRITSTSYDEEKQRTGTLFTIRSLKEDEKDIVYFGGVAFDDVDPFPRITMSPYATDVFEPSDLIKRNEDKNTLMQMKSLQAYGDLICVPEIKKVLFSGKRIEAHEVSHPHDVITPLEKTVSRSPMTRRRTLSLSDVEEGNVLHKLLELKESLFGDDLEIANNVGDGVPRFRFFLKQFDGEKIFFSSLNTTISSDKDDKILEFISNTLNEFPEAVIVVGIAGFNFPPEWEITDHKKKHTKPYIRRMRRDGIDNNYGLVIDDRSDPEWLEIKRKYQNGEVFTEKESELTQKYFGRKIGIHLSDGTFSLSESAEGKRYQVEV